MFKEENWLKSFPTLIFSITSIFFLWSIFELHKLFAIKTQMENIWHLTLTTTFHMKISWSTSFSSMHYGKYQNIAIKRSQLRYFMDDKINIGRVFMDDIISLGSAKFYRRGLFSLSHKCVVYILHLVLSIGPIFSHNENQPWCVYICRICYISSFHYYELVMCRSEI